MSMVNPFYQQMKPQQKDKLPGQKPGRFNPFDGVGPGVQEGNLAAADGRPSMAKPMPRQPQQPMNPWVYSGPGVQESPMRTNETGVGMDWTAQQPPPQRWDGNYGGGSTMDQFRRILEQPRYARQGFGGGK